MRLFKELVACTAIRYWVLQVQGRTPERAVGFQPPSNRLVKKSYLLWKLLRVPFLILCSFYDITTSKIIWRLANKVFYTFP
jgi:hypothetical protein